MPIVETPGKAIDFFLECALDVLVIETFVRTGNGKTLDMMQHPFR